MHAYLLVIVLTIAVSVNAAFIQKRDISAEVQSCIANLEKTNDMFSKFINNVNDYNTSKQNDAVIRSGLSFAQDTNSANKTCCAIVTTLSKEESIAVLNDFGTLAPKMEDLSDALISKKATFELGNLHFSTLASIFAVPEAHFASMTKCFAATNPDYSMPEMNGYANRIKSAFTSLKAAYPRS